MGSGLRRRSIIAAGEGAIGRECLNDGKQASEEVGDDVGPVCGDVVEEATGYGCEKSVDPRVCDWIVSRRGSLDEERVLKYDTKTWYLERKK